MTHCPINFDNFFDFDTDLDSFFGMGRNAVTQPFATRSKPLTITVLDVPGEKQPVTYNGAVGEFYFFVDIKPTSLKAGEPVTVTMKVYGSGNIEQLKLPAFPEIEAFKSYEPESNQGWKLGSSNRSCRFRENRGYQDRRYS